MSECKKTRTVCQTLRTHHGAIIIPYVASAMGTAGTPDRWLLMPKWSKGVWVEFKDHDTPIETHQRLLQEKMNRFSINAVTVRFAEKTVSGMITVYRAGNCEAAEWNGLPDLLRLLGHFCIVRNPALRQSEG